MLGTFGIHVFAGGPHYAEYFATILPEGDLRVMGWVLWHAVSVVLVVLALAYLWLARGANAGLLWVTSALQIGWAGLFLAASVIWHGTLWLQPQWVLFLGFPLLAHLAEWRRQKQVGRREPPRTGIDQWQAGRLPGSRTLSMTWITPFSA